jgi:hypothetical protein
MKVSSLTALCNANIQSKSKEHRLSMDKFGDEFTQTLQVYLSLLL